MRRLIPHLFWIWLLLYTVACSGNRPKYLGNAPEQFLPAQTLMLMDGKDRLIGSVMVGANGSMDISLNAPVEVPDGYVSSHSLESGEGRIVVDYTMTEFGSMLNVYGPKPNGRIAVPYVRVTTDPTTSLPWFELFTPDGRTIDSNSKAWEARKSSSTWTLIKNGYHRVFPQKPEHSLDDQVPSEDVRFVDKDGRLLFICGLSANAEPSIGFLYPDGSLRSVLLIGQSANVKLGDQKEWPSLSLFDVHGTFKIGIDAAENGNPLLTIFEPTKSDSGDLGIYTLDPNNGQEITVKHFFDTSEGRFSWLGPMPRVALPIRLVDERDKIIWKSGAS